MVWQPAEGGEAISAEAWDAGVDGAESGDRRDPVAVVAAEDKVEESDPVATLESGFGSPEEAAVHVTVEPGGAGELSDTPQATLDRSALSVSDEVGE